MGSLFADVAVVVKDMEVVKEFEVQPRAAPGGTRRVYRYRATQRHTTNDSFSTDEILSY